MAFSELADGVGETPFAPQVHFLNFAAVFGNPAFNSLNNVVKRRFFQVWMDDKNDFVIAPGYASFPRDLPPDAAVGCARSGKIVTITRDESAPVYIIKALKKKGAI